MKIVYFLEIDPYVHSGVVKKINHQVLCWKDALHEVEVFVLWPNDISEKEMFLSGNHFYSNFLDKCLPKNFIRTYLTKITCIRRVKRAISKFNPDIIYFRQGIWYPGFLQLLRSHKCIMELNTVDIFEKNFYTRLRRSVYSFGRTKILKETNALVAVSPAILEYYTKFDIPKKVVSNGITLANKVKKNTKSKEGVSIVFVGSRGMQWHGLGHIFKLASQLKDITFNIVGYLQSDFPKITLKNVHFLGWLEKEELDKIYASSNIGIGSFGNHLVGKPIDSTLKVREYLSHGLPVMLGHYDVDFMNTVFVFKCTDENHKLLPIDNIKEWIEDFKDVRIADDEIGVIQSSEKESSRLNFFQQVVTEDANDQITL